MIKNRIGTILKVCVILGMAWAFFSLPANAQEKTAFPFVAQVTADNVNIRAGENKNFETVVQLNKSQEVVVVDEKYDWFKIRLPANAQVFIAGQFLEPLRDGIAKVTGTKVNVRARPGLKTGVVGKLRQGTLVKVIEHRNDGWWRVGATGGMFGWVYKDLVTFKSKNVPPPLSVTLPTRNIYILKRQQEAQRLAEEAKRKEDEKARTVYISGVVRSLADKAISQEVRHFIVDKEGKTYLLKGYRNVLDAFLNQTVAVRGLPQDETDLNYPVLLVTRITLSL